MSDGPSAPGDGSLDSLFRALAHHRRRKLLLLLSNQDGSLTVTDLAGMIATDERDAELVDIDDDEINTIYIELYHWHLPKLADCGVITYEGNKGPVTLSEQTASVTAIIESAEESI